MDISLFTECKSIVGQPVSLRPMATQVAYQRANPKLATSAMMRSSAPSTPSASSSTPVTPKVTINRPSSLRRTPSQYRWRSSPDVVIGSLQEMCFTITGTLDCLKPEDLVEMIESCGGTVFKTLAKKTQYLIAGNNASEKWINEAITSSKAVLKEKEFLDLVSEKGKQFQKALEIKRKAKQESRSGSSGNLSVTTDESDD